MSFFAARENELLAFITRAERNLAENGPRKIESEQRVQGSIELVRSIGSDWFGFDVNGVTSGGSLRGMTIRDTYTKAAHFALLKEMLLPGKIILTTEWEGTVPPVLPNGLPPCGGLV
jgi:hypothetical protein